MAASPWPGRRPSSLAPSQQLTGATVMAADGPFALPDAGYWGLKAPGERLVDRLRPVQPGLPAGPCPLRHPLARMVDRRPPHPGRPGHLPVRRRPSPTRIPEHAPPQHGERRRGRAERHLRRLPLRQAGARRAARDGSRTVAASRLSRHARRLRRAGRAATPHPRGRGSAGSARDPRPGRGRCRPGSGRPAAAPPGLHGGSGRERAVLRSDRSQVTIEADTPLKAEEAEWYPDLYVARPAVRLVVTTSRWRAGRAMVRLLRTAT